MDAKSIAILVVFVLFGLPLLIKLLIYSTSIGSMTPEQSAEEIASIVEEAAVPWWINVMSWFAELGSIGAILIISLIFFLKWIREV